MEMETNNVDKAEKIYLTIVDNVGMKASLQEICEAYLGLSKIYLFKGNWNLAYENAMKSLKTIGNDLNTLLWLIYQKEINNEEKLVYSDIIWNTLPKDLSCEKDRENHQWSKATCSLGLAKCKINQVGNYEKALQIGNEIRNDQICFDSLLGLGECTKNIDILEQALNLCSKLNETLTMQGKIYYLLGTCGNNEKSSEYLLHGLDISKKLNDENLESLCLIGLGNNGINPSVNLQLSMEIGVKLKDHKIIRDSYLGIWQYCHKIGNIFPKLPHSLHSAALNVSRSRLAIVENENPEKEKVLYSILEAISLIGLSRMRLGDQLMNYQKAQLLGETFAPEDKRILAYCKVGIGHCKVHSKENFSSALSIGIALGDDRIEAEARVGLGNIRMEPENNFLRAIELGKLLGDDLIQLQGFVGLGNARLGGNREYGWYLQGREIASRIGDDEREVDCLVGLARCTMTLNADKSREYFTIAFQKSAGYPLSEQKVKKAFEALCKMDGAYYISAKKLNLRNRDLHGQIICCLGLYNLSFLLGDYAVAEKELNEAIIMGKSNKDYMDEIEAFVLEVSGKKLSTFSKSVGSSSSSSYR